MDNKTRVLIVDDSPFSRLVIARKLSTAGDIEVIGMAGDGQRAVSAVAELQPDVVTMDVEMPVMDGLAAVRKIMAECPTPIIMLSSLTSEGADTTVKALEAGAVDCYAKPSATNPVGMETATIELQDKVRAAARIPRNNLRAVSAAGRIRRRVRAASSKTSSARVLVIGSSTGGPRALTTLFAELPGTLQTAVVVVQHMPPDFTASLAQRLNDLSPLPIKEAKDGDWLRPGRVLVAPGGFHLEVRNSGEVVLSTAPPENGVRPAVDVTLRSISAAYGGGVVAAILTGMGVDGTAGAREVRARGGRIIAEHRSTCTVYGMPRSIIESGNADVVAPLNRMSGAILDLIGSGEGVQQEAAKT